MSYQTNKTQKGFIALSPLFFFVAVYLLGGILTGDFYEVPISVVFLLTSIYAIALLGEGKSSQRISDFSKGAGSKDMMLMIWIFVLAGAFTGAAKSMGCIDATVNLILAGVPPRLLLAGLFVAACVVSFAVGTSVGTIAALMPIATGLAPQMDISVPLLVGVVVGGAFFGDNLSFISDTTVVATSTQGCSMHDKFKVNAWISFPAAIVVLTAYVVTGFDISSAGTGEPIDLLRVLPYIVVVATALSGLHVTIVLTLGLVTTAIVGLSSGTVTPVVWLKSMSEGMLSMGELIIVSLMAGGLLEMISKAGGIDFVINRLLKHLSDKRSGELTIGLLVSFIDICTANNTIAILTVGGISKKISQRFGIDRRKCASLLDTFSCCTQGLLPYGAQLLMAAGIAGISPVEIIPNLYYTFALIVSVLLSILLRYPRRYS